MIEDPRIDRKFEPLRTKGFVCLVDPAWRDSLQPLLNLADPREWTEDWVEVKKSTVRTILRGTIPSPETHGPEAHPVEVHLKLFRAVRLADRARDALTGSRSARELRNLDTARSLGLPCIRPLAAGTYSGSFGSRSILLTLTEPGEPLPRGPLTAADAAAAGALLRRAHDAGLHARDLHPGNLLRREDGTIVLLDLTSAAFADPLEPHERARALAFFCLDLDGNVRDPAARPLVAAYDATPDILTAAVTTARRLRNRAVSAFGRRAFRPCRTTVVEHAPRKARDFLHVPAEDLWPQGRHVLDKLDTLTPIKSGRRGAVYLTDDLAIKKRSAAAACRLFESAYWLAFAGVPTPTPVALRTFKKVGVVATRRLHRVSLLEDLQNRLADDDAALLDCAAEFGASVGRLHSFGLRNRDMKFENLIRDPDANRIVMVDLDGVRRRVPGDNRGRASDLGRLLAAFNHADRPGGQPVVDAFLRAYVRTCRRLLRPVRHRRHVLEQADVGAREWAAAH